MYNKDFAISAIEKHHNYSKESDKLTCDVFFMVLSCDVAQCTRFYEQAMDQLKRVYEMRCKLIKDGLNE